MIKFIKTTKWWMYLPFACLSFALFDWIFDGYSEKNRMKRLIFLLINILWSCLFLSGIFLLIIVK